MNWCTLYNASSWDEAVYTIHSFFVGWSGHRFVVEWNGIHHTSLRRGMKRYTLHRFIWSISHILASTVIIPRSFATRLRQLCDQSGSCCRMFSRFLYCAALAGRLSVPTLTSNHSTKGLYHKNKTLPSHSQFLQEFFTLVFQTVLKVFVRGVLGKCLILWWFVEKEVLVCFFDVCSRYTLTFCVENNLFIFCYF